VAAFRVRRTYSFTCLPESLIRDIVISDRAVRLWALLDRYAAGKDAVSLTREVLAADLGCSLDSIDRALAELVRAGWLTHNAARGGRPREYQLWISADEVRTRADNPPEVLRTGADNLPHGCGQPAAPVRTTPIADLGKRRSESKRVESPPTPKADALGEPCPRHKHLGHVHPRCRACGTAGRPEVPTPQPPAFADVAGRCPHDASPAHCPDCRKEAS
jgi:hypothetical protein